MLYTFYVNFHHEDGHFVHCSYVTTFDGVWMLANVLNQSERVVNFIVYEETKKTYSRQFDAENLVKWR